MDENVSKQVTCTLCKATYEPVFEPAENEGAYRVHCSSCVKGIQIARNDFVRVAIKEVLKIEGEALALAVQTYLSDCPCGQPFSYDAGKRCPECLKKIKREIRGEDNRPGEYYYIWNLKKLKDMEGRLFEHILNRLDSEHLSMQQLIDSFESGQIDPGTYMEELENLQIRESKDVAVIKTWAILVGPEMAFRAAEEHALMEKYGTRILVSMAAGMEAAFGTNILTTLTREEKNLDGPLRKEIQTFIKKIAGGF
ncbi:MULTISPECIES: hypothetical protein [unclassified Nitrospina]|uniref:hypothetical protein n=1 Tax=unclassified Nitrospina TaxID=2638683 RepID=UPI003F9AB78A